MSKLISENPKLTDQILFELTTSNTNGDLIDPYKINKVVIHHMTRDFVTGNANQFDQTIEDVDYTTYFSKAETVKVFGTDSFPAWLSTDTGNALMTRTATGEFELLWTPEFSREGDYIVCWTWTPLVGDNPLSAYLPFYLASDTLVTTSIPTHFTDPEKYTTLLERYTPELFKLQLSDTDLTPTVLDKFNKAVASGFIVLEDLANQIVDLLDANAVHEQLLVYLANTLNVSLKSTDPTLWRRQIKRAIPLYKKKGTRAGLEEALAQAGIIMNSLTRLWQVVSSSTWQDAFIVSDEVSFELSKLAVITPSIDTLNFEVYLRLDGETTYTELTTDYVSFSNSGGVTTMTWVGDELSVNPIVLAEGDIVRIIYKIATPASQSTEDYIRTLPLADQRDEAEVTYPKKNWNVRLISEDDTMFDVICPDKHTFHDPVVYGKIVTEFPYSENIYNMEEYNFSRRDSTNPCHLDRNFLDSCSCCISSKFNIDLEIEQLSDSRIDEAEQIIREYVPFHAQVQTMNFTGSVSDYMPPNVESIECIAQINGNEDVIMGQGVHTRIASQDVKRNMLASSSVSATGTGTGTNREIVLYSPDVRFDRTILGVNEADNLLEILSGPDTGEYEVTNPHQLSIQITQASPDSIGFPLDASAFTFRLSNELFSGSVTTVTQDDLYIFTDSSVDLLHTKVVPGWKITVTSPAPQAGTYVISEIYPNDSFKLATWPTTTDVPSITYQLKTDTDVAVGSVSTTGNVDVSRQGRLNASSAIETDFGLQEGHWVLIGSTQYKILSFTSTSEFYIASYTGGNMGVTAIKVYRRLLDSAVGYVMHKGMRLTTPTNHETGLGITNGANGSGPTLENNSVKENYMVLIGTNYYAITQIDGTVIDLEGPMLDWGVSGTSVAYSIIKFPKTSITIEGQDFYLVDRRNNDVVSYTIETGTSMAVMAAAMNRYNNNQPLSPVVQSESITCIIETR